ncbi:MAG: hypothetical protein WBD75_00860 [Phycisphaerae bacterium]
MIIDDLRLMKAQRLARVEPRLCFVRVSIPELLERVRQDLFPEERHSLKFYFVRRGPLACICPGETAATIYVHEVLNLSETPAEVMSAICKHELLHLVIPARAVNNRMTNHPPEFWVRERKIAPERYAAWEWVWMNVGDCLRPRPRLERIDVTSRWKAERRLKMTAREHWDWLESRRRLSMADSGGW